MRRCVPARSLQSGIALPVALVFTLLITLLGLALFRGSIVSELIVANQQQKFISDEAAQSSVESVWEYSYLKDQIRQDATGIETDNPAPVFQPSSATGLEEDYDIFTAKGTVNIGGDLTIQFCGEVEPIGGSIDANESAVTLIDAMVDVTGISTIENTNSKSMVVQRAALTSVRSGRRGNCAAH